MDGRLLLGITLGLLATWIALLVLIWVLRPRNVALRHLLGVIPDLLRLIRDLLADRKTPLAVRLALKSPIRVNRRVPLLPPSAASATWATDTACASLSRM